MPNTVPQVSRLDKRRNRRKWLNTPLKMEYVPARVCVYVYIYIYMKISHNCTLVNTYYIYIYILILKLQLLSINILSTCINGVCCFNLPVPPAKTPHGKGPTWECCCSRCGPARLAPPPPRRNGMSTMGAPLQRFTKGSHRNIIYIHGAFSTSGWMINDKNSANWNRLK